MPPRTKSTSKISTFSIDASGGMPGLPRSNVKPVGWSLSTNRSMSQNSTNSEELASPSVFATTPTTSVSSPAVSVPYDPVISTISTEEFLRYAEGSGSDSSFKPASPVDLDKDEYSIAKRSDSYFSIVQMNDDSYHDEEREDVQDVQEQELKNTTGMQSKANDGLNEAVQALSLANTVVDRVKTVLAQYRQSTTDGTDVNVTIPISRDQ